MRHIIYLNMSHLEVLLLRLRAYSIRLFHLSVTTLDSRAANVLIHSAKVWSVEWRILISRHVFCDAKQALTFYSLRRMACVKEFPIDPNIPLSDAISACLSL